MPSRLKSLELLGYKTFATKSQFLFGEKITAVVGPNGSGKSNIADSIRWVLGEQSFSLLRGKKTEDMIFAGSEHRPRASMAQATVTFDNSDGWLPIDFSEVSIARRAYRDGQNEYLLNGQRTRLRDITELLGKVGLAERTYTIIGQGLVDTALSLKAEERRALFEEAAGIGLYRAKREDSLRKLDDTQRNLERVHDIITEIRPRVKTLERQASRAREYEQIKNELDGVLKVWYGYHWHEGQKALMMARASAETQATALTNLQDDQRNLDQNLTDLRAKAATVRAQLNTWQRDVLRLRTDSESISRKLAVADERLRSFNEQRENHLAELKPLEAELEAQTKQLNDARAEVMRLEAERDSTRAQIASLEAVRAQREAERKTLNERQIAAKERVVKLQSEIEQKRARKSQIAEERERLIKVRADQEKLLAESETVVASKRSAFETVNAQATQSRTRLDQAEAAITTLTSRITRADAELAEFAKRLNDALGEENKLVARAEALAQLHADLAGEGSALNILRQSQLRIEAELADIITAPPELEIAIAAALGQFVNTFLISDVNAALDLLAQSEGRAAIYPLPTSPISKTKIEMGEEMIGIASQLVTCDSRYRAVVDSLLGHAIITRTRESAQQLATHLPAGAVAVTLSGELFFANGAILGGRDSSATTLSLARERRALPMAIDEAKQKRVVLERERSQREADIHQMRDQVAAITKARGELQKDERGSAVARDDARLDLERAEANAKLNRDQIASLNLQIAKTQTDENTFAAEINSLAVSLAEADSAAQTIASQTFELTADDLANKIGLGQTAFAVASRSVEEKQGRLSEMARAVDRITEQISSRRSRLTSITTESDNFVASLKNDRAQLEILTSQIESLQKLIAPAEEELAKIEAELARVESAEGDARARLHAAERFHSEAQLEFARKTDELDSLRRRITDDFGLVTLDYPEGVAGPEPLPLEGLVETLPHVESLPEGLEDLLNRRRSQLRRIGLINPEALKEFEEVKARHEFLTEQVADLEKAAAQLREVIAELDTLMEREFWRTFEAVAEQFKDTFSRLFGGGSAKLILTEPEDLTNSGIDILARLPGRKQQGLALLSGGERALTSCALVFALLRVNPPPFAMLDEVDAALDEANVGRFRDLLVELSQSTQFVVITHNRNTVQAAETVYGISMGADSASQAISLKLDGENVPKGN